MLKKIFENKTTAATETAGPVNSLPLSEYLSVRTQTINSRVESVVEAILQAEKAFDRAALPQLFDELENAVETAMATAWVRPQIAIAFQKLQDAAEKAREESAQNEQRRADLAKRIAATRARRKVSGLMSGGGDEDDFASITQRELRKLENSSLDELSKIVRAESSTGDAEYARLQPINPPYTGKW